MQTSFMARNGRKPAEILQDLRRLVSEPPGLRLDRRTLAFGIPALDACLPQRGLAFGTVHEIQPAARHDVPAALGFVTALLGRLPRGGPVVFITAHEDTSVPGPLHGHGLNSLGLDPARVILVEARDNKDALWATEEVLRSGVPGAVASAVGSSLDLLSGQRLHLAAVDSGIPLFLLRPPDVPGANVAATRWRIGAAPAGRDRFSLITQWRWHVRLERCRNGRPGEWLVEFDHGAYRFSLPASMASPALSRRANT
jgi:protein ImuA